MKVAVLALFALIPLLHAAPPNVVIILADDLGYGDLGCYGHPVFKTPRIDRMAAEGVKMMQFNTPAPFCAPTRASLLTGRYPFRCGMTQNPAPDGGPEADALSLPKSEVTLAQVLKSAGYATGMVGKWHLGHQAGALPTDRGFDDYYGIPYSNDMGPAAEGSKSNPDRPLPKGPGKGKGKPGAGKGDAEPETGLKGNAQPPLPLVEDQNVVERVKAEQHHTFTRRYTERAVKFIQANQKQPFFLYLPHNAVHFPHYPHQDWTGKSGISLQKDWAMEVDWSVGQVLDTLRELKLDSKTLVIFTSDNGGPLNQGADNTPLRGSKGSTLEGGIRVCTIAWWPGKIAAGSKTNEITAHMDWLPTFGTLARCKSVGELKLDGKDISPVLLGQKEATGHDVFYYYAGFNLQAVRSGAWKLHLGKGELYNLDEDIGEAKNVAAEHADIVARLHKQAETMKADLGDKTKDAPGVRELGRVEHPQPLIRADGTVREGFNKIAKTLP